MRIRVESPYPIGAVLFKPVKQRYVASVKHYVHHYNILIRDLDTFLREIFHYYDSNYAQKVRERDEYVWYASMTLYYRSTTIALNLSQSRLYHNPRYKLQFRIELSGDFGFYPVSVEFWECDTKRDVYTYSNVREILNAIVQGVTK